MTHTIGEVKAFRSSGRAPVAGSRAGSVAVVATASLDGRVAQGSACRAAGRPRLVPPRSVGAVRYALEVGRFPGLAGALRTGGTVVAPASTFRRAFRARWIRICEARARQPDAARSRDRAAGGTGRRSCAGTRPRLLPAVPGRPAAALPPRRGLRRAPGARAPQACAPPSALPTLAIVYIRGAIRHRPPLAVLGLSRCRRPSVPSYARRPPLAEGTRGTIDVLDPRSWTRA
jgi:hypothetical protein